jgi:hypothetical protein
MAGDQVRARHALDSAAWSPGFGARAVVITMRLSRRSDLDQCTRWRFTQRRRAASAQHPSRWTIIQAANRRQIVENRFGAATVS